MGRTPAKKDGSQCSAGTDDPTPRGSKPTMSYSAATDGCRPLGDDGGQAKAGTAGAAGVDDQHALGRPDRAVAGTSSSARVIFRPPG